MKGLPLEPVDGFILSRIDGTTSEHDIGTLTGLGSDQIKTTLEKLVKLGVVTFAELPPPPKPEPRPSGPPPDRPIREVTEDRTAAPRGLYDPAELDEDVEIDRDHRRAILDRFYQLADLTHYEVLGVQRTDDKKTIRRAYFALAPLFHPDRHFRKRLGSFKAKMEAIFGRITLSHDVLTDAEKRAEYDDYLGDVESTREIEKQLETRTAIPAPSPAPPPPSEPEKKPSSPAMEQARRDALARRLTGRRPSSMAPSAITSAPPTAIDPDALKRHYDDRMTAVREKLARDHLGTAREAAKNGDWVAATTAYKLALSVLPNDVEIQKEAREAQEKASAVLGAQYRKQATYEERNADWQSASRSWVRVARTLPEDAEAHERAAHAIMKANGNLHEAAQLAQRAIALDPQNPKYRGTLAEVYVAAGLILNAKREAEEALRLAPTDATIQALVKKVAKLK